MYRIIFVFLVVNTQAIIRLMRIPNANMILTTPQADNQYTNVSNITCEQCLCRMFEMNNLTTSIACQPNQMTCQILFSNATTELKIDTNSVVYLKPTSDFIQTTDNQQSMSTSISTQGMTTTTTPIPLVYLTRTGDTIVGLYDTRAGQSSGGTNGQYSNFNEEPHSAIDYNLTTKYLNFGSTGCVICTVNQPGQGTGFYIIPSISNRTVARALLFATANDNPVRDPLTVTLEGSNATRNATLNLGSSWTLLYSGTTGISLTFNSSRFTYGIQQNFSNTHVFASYRLLITSQKGSSSSVQYSEAHILGYF